MLARRKVNSYNNFSPNPFKLRTSFDPIKPPTAHRTFTRMWNFLGKSTGRQPSTTDPLAIDVELGDMHSTGATGASRMGVVDEQAAETAAGPLRYDLVPLVRCASELKATL